MCGEHGGDPASIAFLGNLDLDYVSCSPYRVPIARSPLRTPRSTANRLRQDTPSAAAGGVDFDAIAGCNLDAVYAF